MKQRITFQRCLDASPTKDGMKGLSLITGGVEALGHGMFVDEKAIGQVSDLLSGKTLPSYLTHDGAGWEDRLGREVGLFTNVRKDGLKARADFAWLDAFKKNDPRNFDTLSELAQKAPETFGISIVFNGSIVWVGSDGTEVSCDSARPEGADTIPHVRFSEIISADFVGQPAANPDGLFSMDKETIALEAHNAALSEKDTQITTLTAQLQERDTTIVELKGSLDKAGESLSAKDKELEFLKAKLSEAEQFDMRKAGSAAPQFKEGNAKTEPKTPSEKYAHYKSIKDEVERMKYFEANKADIWAASRA